MAHINRHTHTMFIHNVHLSNLLNIYHGQTPNDQILKTTLLTKGRGTPTSLKCESFSHVRLSAIPWTTAHQAPLSMGFSRQKYWSGLPLPSPILFSSVQFSLVTQSCPTLCNSMNCSMPGLPVHHQLLEFTQTHVH